MTKEAALHYFWSSLGLPAYQEDAVPTGEDKPEYPYLTYEVATGSWDEIVPLAVNLWYRSTSWTAANAMARHISEEISRGGVVIPCDGGSIWITRGDPFARSSGDDSDNMIKRKILNITVQYNTED